MWNLSVFERDSGKFVREYELHDMDGPTLTELFDIRDNLDPVESRENPVPVEKLHKLDSHLNESVTENTSYNYYVGLSAD